MRGFAARGRRSFDGVMLVRNLGLCLLLSVMMGCSAAPIISRVKEGLFPTYLPAMGWDVRPEASAWTAATLSAVARYDSVLAAAVPGDIRAWCPAYAKNGLDERRAFWAGVLSALAKPESGWNPRASGGGGRYIGLLQISPQTARANRCAATSAAGLKDGAANLACGVQIMARQVGRDGVVAGNGRQGLGRDWGPINKSASRAAIAGWTAKQNYCR